MATVIKIANLIVKNKDKEGVSDFLASLPNSDEWKSFVEGELKKSNEINNKNLGGQQPRNLDDDNDEKDYEMNMEKIMAKFSNFNSGMSNRSQSNDEDEEEEEDNTEINRKEEEEDETKHESPEKK